MGHGRAILPHDAPQSFTLLYPYTTFVECCIKLCVQPPRFPVFAGP